MGEDRVLFINLESMVKCGTGGELKLKYPNTIARMESSSQDGYLIVLYLHSQSRMVLQEIETFLALELDTRGWSTRMPEYERVNEYNFAEMLVYYLPRRRRGVLVNGDEEMGTLPEMGQLKLLMGMFNLVHVVAEKYFG